MLDWLKRKFLPLRITDPVFGSLLHMGGYWEGAGRFAPTSGDIEWFVDGPKDGPGEAQRRLFQKIGERYAELLPAVRAALAKHVAEWDPSSAGADLSKVLRLVAISVPESESPTMEWDLSFESTLRGDPCFDVAMKGWKPTGEVEVST